MTARGGQVFSPFSSSMRDPQPLATRGRRGRDDVVVVVTLRRALGSVVGTRGTSVEDSRRASRQDDEWTRRGSSTNTTKAFSHSITHHTHSVSHLVSQSFARSLALSLKNSTSHYYSPCAPTSASVSASSRKQWMTCLMANLNRFATTGFDDVLRSGFNGFIPSVQALLLVATKLNHRSGAGAGDVTTTAESRFPNHSVILV